MAEFNILAALGKELSNDVIKPRAPREDGPHDPDRITWPYLRYNELKPNTDYIMRFMPADPVKCPKGYIKKSMYQFPYELDMVQSQGWAKHKSHYAMVPGCLDPNREDPIKDILRDIYDTVKSDTERGQMVRDMIADQPEFKEFLKVLTKTWTQILFPVLVYATCEEQKIGDSKYPKYVNYTADRKLKNGLFRILQINDVKEVREEVMPNVTERHMLEDTDSDDDMYTGGWNDPIEGCNVKFKHTSGPPKGYKFAASDVRTALDEDLLAKLAIETNYPDLVKRELENSIKDSDTMLNLLKSCPMTQSHLIPLGFIR